MAKDRRAEFGDFQTPLALAQEVTRFLQASGMRASAVVEPTCGQGRFLEAAVETFGRSVDYYGFDVDTDHVRHTHNRLAAVKGVRYRIECENFYDKDWQAFFRSLPEGLLVVGNPPWVTNAALGAMEATNLPEKSNFQGLVGLAAKTGKANFDIAEWMILRLLDALEGRTATLAMLCKSSTARRVLVQVWRSGLGIAGASIHRIDARTHFGVSAEACLLLVTPGRTGRAAAPVYGGLSFGEPLTRLGMCGGDLVADVDAFERVRGIDGKEHKKWRSGVKHDAAKVLELERQGDRYINGLGERCDLETICLFPLLKSSDLAHGRVVPARHVLLTQRHPADDTVLLETRAPKTWRYLLEHAEYLDRRKSAVYRRRHRFAVFGVGPYTFAPWKVAVSGLYKNIAFRVVGGVGAKPIVFDDTCYFIPCASQEEAAFFSSLLDSETARRFLRSLIFLDAKRPVTAAVLKRIDLCRLAARLGREEEVRRYLDDLENEPMNREQETENRK